MKPRLLAAILLAGLLLTGCSIQVQPVENPRQIYAGFYPVYALTAPLLENAEKLQLKCLTQPQDGCLRDYALSDWDLSVVAYDADAVVLAGELRKQPVRPGQGRPGGDYRHDRGGALQPGKDWR